MLNDQDIDKLTSALASKKDVEEIKGGLGDIKGLFYPTQPQQIAK